MNFSFLLTGKLRALARDSNHSLVDVFVIRHVLDDHAGGHQPLTVIIRNLKSKLILAKIKSKYKTCSIKSSSPTSIMSMIST